MNYLKLIFILLVFTEPASNAQVINKFGIKGGISISNFQTESNLPGYIVKYSKEGYRYLSASIGIFVEFFDSRFFCISTELHYRNKGEQNGKDFLILQPVNENNHQVYKLGNVNNRFQYLTLEILPRWKYVVNTEDKLYLFAGPVLNYRIGNSNTDNEKSLEFSNSKLEPGIAVGIGNEIWDLLSIELRYEYDFSNVYEFVYGNQSLTRKHSSFLLLAGVSLKKLLRIGL